MSRPLAIDLFCGLFGWGEALADAGWEVVGFDIEDMRGQFGFERLPHCQLVIQDVRTLHGSQFKDAALIVASPPCQEYSYMAMPWKPAKAKAAAIRADMTGESLERLNRLFNACFRIQAEASLAAGRHIPMIVENVCGAQKWVGRARWNFGSFYLWGDVPALMPETFNGRKLPGNNAPRLWKDRRSIRLNDENRVPEDSFYLNSSNSVARARASASAMIAKIPQPLAHHIATTFFPRQIAAAGA